ncbi:MAG: ATP-binding cassette domain-containing protein, partial [Actinomycetota bacterium]|nr:ATP-binding cassette domain-containing protein [Actinomycetota bacterium]
MIVDGLSVSFDGGATRVVENISFTLPPGGCVALVGESGSGKSVTARALLGLAGRNATVSARSLTHGDTDLAALTEPQWRTV